MVYFDPKRVLSYGGVDALRRVTREPRKIVEEWVSEKDAYTIHKPARRHFRRRRVVVGGPRQQRQADLVDLSNLKTDTDGMTFLLTVIDVFTKVAWCVPLKNKSAASLVTALKRTFTEGWPKTLQTDHGLEFLNRSVQALLKKNGIHHFSTHNADTKAGIVERFNRTLKTRIFTVPPTQHHRQPRSGISAHVLSGLGWTDIIRHTRIGRRLPGSRQHDAARAGEGDTSQRGRSRLGRPRGAGQ